MRKLEKSELKRVYGAGKAFGRNKTQAWCDNHHGNEGTGTTLGTAHTNSQGFDCNADTSHAAAV